MEQEVWEEFYDKSEVLAFESECLIAKLLNKSVEEASDIDTDHLPQGKERELVIKQRVGQGFFRSAVMSSYNYRCCISGVRTPQLLEACHIADWASNIENRTNSKNGLCLNPFFHKAYDNYLLAITPEFKVILTKELLLKTDNPLFKTYLEELNGRTITLPDKFKPQKELLGLHYNEFRDREMAR